MKKCKNCGIEKNETEFYSHAKTKDKLRSSCKDCTKKESSKRYKPRKVHVCEFCKSMIQEERFTYQYDKEDEIWIASTPTNLKAHGKTQKEARQNLLIALRG